MCWKANGIMKKLYSILYNVPNLVLVFSDEKLTYKRNHSSTSNLISLNLYPYNENNNYTVGVPVYNMIG